MILGIFFLTSQREGELGEGRAFTSIAEALMAYEQRTLSLQAKIKIRLGSETRETTLGRALFNEVLPDDFGFVDSEVTKKGLSGIVDRLAETYPKVVVAAVLDQLKARLALRRLSALKMSSHQERSKRFSISMRLMPTRFRSNMTTV
jgi:DNA-directed RNA polymerase subunit beta'